MWNYNFSNRLNQCQLSSKVVYDKKNLSMRNHFCYKKVGKNMRTWCFYDKIGLVFDANNSTKMSIRFRGMAPGCFPSNILPNSASKYKI